MLLILNKVHYFIPIITHIHCYITGHTVSKVWQDDSIKSNKEAHRQGLSTGAKNPSGKGKRLIILHIGKF